MLTPAQYATLQPKVAANQAAMRAAPNPRDPAIHPLPFPEVGNAETGAVEQFELLRDLPDRFTAYLKNGCADGTGAALPVTVWTGDQLGRAVVYTVGRRRNRFGERQRYGRATIGGAVYAWQGQGAGMYATFRRIKAKA